MTTQTEMSKSELKFFLTEWVATAINEGRDPHEGAKLAIAEARKEGHLQQVIDLLMPDWIVTAWRQGQQFDRMDTRAVVSGKRRVNVENLAKYSLLNNVYNVAGAWLKLADLTRHHCEWLAADYAKRAASNEREAQFFTELAQSLEGEQKVGERYSDDDLTPIYKAVGDD